MKCVVGNANLGIWCRAIHCLTQVGDGDIYFDFSDTILTIATTNMSHSTFATFLFFKPFFTSYRMNSDEPEKVVIPARNILKPYRTQKVAKSYLQSEIIYDPSQDFVTITSEGRSHATTTYTLGTTNSEDIMLDSDPYSFSNCIKADAKTLSSCLANFSHVKGLADLTLKIDGTRVTLRNCVTDVARKDSVVTEYNLSSHDFSEFDVQEETVEFAFGYREFKVFTTLAEQLKLPVNIHFQDGQEPIVIVVVKTDTFESRLCLATKAKDPFADSEPPTSTTPLTANGRISNVNSHQGSLGHATNSNSIEINRREENSTPAAPETPLDRNTHEPQAKRPRRTEVPVEPVMDSEEPGESNIQNFAGFQIAQVVEQMEIRKASSAYKTFQRVMSGPRLSESEYLKTLPGNDELLCPDSDNEDEGS